MPLIIKKNMRRLKIADEKPERDDDNNDSSSSSSMQICSTLDYNNDFIVHVLESLSECPPFIVALSNCSIKAYCPFMDMMEPYRTANRI